MFNSNGTERLASLAVARESPQDVRAVVSGADDCVVFAIRRHFEPRPKRQPLTRNRPRHGTLELVCSVLAATSLLTTACVPADAPSPSRRGGVGNGGFGGRTKGASSMNR